MLRLIAAIAFLLVTLWGGNAGAQDRHGLVTFDLRPEGGDLPTHLCVVSEARSARAKDRLWDLLEAVPNTDKAARTSGATSWRVLPKAWDGTDTSADNQQCAKDPIKDPIGDCRPLVELPSELGPKNNFFVACTADRNQGGATNDPRPLFVLLEHHEASPPQIETIQLAGGVATIGVAADVHHGSITARSIGGGYLPNRRSERGVREESQGGRGGETPAVYIVLSAEPRCRIVELTLPRTTLHANDRDQLQVRAHGVALDVDKCVGPLLGTEVLQVRLPKAPLGVGHIDVELGGGQKGGPTAQFGGRYDGAWPNPPFALKFKQVTFTWRPPPCIYPDLTTQEARDGDAEDLCPSATLENGTVCAPSINAGACEYRCPGRIDDAAGDIELPLEVTFEKTAPIQRWTDKLARSGQKLTSYVPADEIYLSASVNEWTTDVPDNTIRGVEIYGEDGQARRYGVTPLDEPRQPQTPDQSVVEGDKPIRPRAFRLPVPGASCEPVRYKPVGDRTYDDREAKVENGKLEFREEWRAARRVGFNVTFAAGGGPSISSNRSGSGTAPWYFSGLGMFAVEVRPRKPKLARLAFEFRVGGTLGRYAVTEEEETAAEADPGTTETASTTRAGGYARILAEPGLVVSAHQRVAIGFGFGLGMATGFRTNKDVVGKGLRFIYSPNVDLRFRVSRWLKVILQLRGVLHERPFRQGESTKDLDLDKDQAGSFLILAGVQASF